MVIFGNFLSENTVFLDEKLPKITIVSPKYASWCSIQEWRSICADTVLGIEEPKDMVVQPDLK